MPKGLTVGGSLDLRGTKITALPDGLTVGGELYLRGTKIRNRDNFHRLCECEYVPGRYLFVDGILTHVKSKHTVQGYTLFKGKIKGQNVVSDGVHYAHCKNFREGVADLLFKTAVKRGASQYQGLSLDTVVKLDDAKTMYRIITGACRQGTERFVSNLRNHKDEYTIRELIALTSGQYGSECFKAFFSN